MSAETRKDIESEIGKNGWRLAFRTTMGVALVVLIPTLAGLVGYGALGQQVDNNAAEIKEVKKDIDDLDTRDSDRKAAQAAIIQNLKDIGRRITELKRSMPHNSQPIGPRYRGEPQ